MPFLNVPSKHTGLVHQANHTELSQVPMMLMFGQPKNTQHINFKMESATELSSAMVEILKERSNSLDFVLRETMADIKSFFSFETKLAYEITAVPYARLAPINLQNIIGLKSNLFDYAKKLDTALGLASTILEFELAGMTKLIAQLLTDRGSLTTRTPISAVSTLTMHTVEVGSLKEELAQMVGYESKNPYVTFGATYYSLGEWKECNALVADLSKRLGKIKATKYDKDIRNTTALLDKLIIRCQKEDIPKSNIETYAKLIEETSANVAFAGAVIHMVQTLIQTLNNHNEILKVEVDDWRKHNK